MTRHIGTRLLGVVTRTYYFFDFENILDVLNAHAKNSLHCNLNLKDVYEFSYNFNKKKISLTDSKSAHSKPALIV